MSYNKIFIKSQESSIKILQNYFTEQSVFSQQPHLCTNAKQQGTIFKQRCFAILQDKNNLKAAKKIDVYNLILVLCTINPSQIYITTDIYIYKYISKGAYSLCKLFMIVNVDFLNKIHIIMKLRSGTFVITIFLITTIRIV